MRLRLSRLTTDAARTHSITSCQARCESGWLGGASRNRPRSTPSTPVTTWKSMRLRAKAQAISGTQQEQQFASHSPVSVFG